MTVQFACCQQLEWKGLSVVHFIVTAEIFLQYNHIQYQAQDIAYHKYI
jgi:hypothetical protein